MRRFLIGVCCAVVGAGAFAALTSPVARADTASSSNPPPHNTHHEKSKKNSGTTTTPPPK